MIQIPGKLFILGEYSVMGGGEAILAALKPSFECGWSNSTRIHPDSPAGRFLSENQTQVFTQIAKGLGTGFGSSTAELIGANAFLETPWPLDRLWEWYRSSFAPASGADLVVQSLALKEGPGFYRYQIDAQGYRVSRIELPLSLKQSCYLFHSPPTQKIPTYSDLENKKGSLIDSEFSNRLIHRWMESFNPSLLTEWADELARIGFESLFAHEVRKAILKVPGVLGVKGCGAGLNDVFMVVIHQDQPQKILNALEEVANHFHLKPLGNLLEHLK